MVFLILIATVVVLVAIHFIMKAMTIRQRYGHIPGPKGLPIIGNVHQMDRKNPWVTISDWGKDYGPLMKVNLMGQIVLVCNTFESVRDMLETKGKDFGGRHRGVRSGMVTGSYGFMRMDVQDTKWRLSRRLLHSSVKAFGPGLSRIEHYAQQLSEEFVETFINCNCEAVDPLTTIFDTTLGMITLMTFGRKLDNTSAVFHSIKTMTDNSNEAYHVGRDGFQLEIFPWMKYFGNHTHKILMEAQVALQDIWRWYKYEISPLEDSELDDSLGKPYMKVIRDYNSQCAPEARISEDDMRGNAAQVTFAGVLTTTTTLYSTILILLHNPEVKKKMMNEIDKVLGSRLPSLKDRNNMPYMNALLNEVMRFISTGPLGVPHRSMCDTDILGIKVPKGTQIMPNLYNVHYDKEIFGDPEVFRPERYLDKEGALLPADHDVWRHTVPFGMGMRICAGMLFAQYRLFLWTCILYQRFDIVADPNNPLPPCDIKSGELNGFSLMPQTYKAIFIPKDQEIVS